MKFITALLAFTFIISAHADCSRDVSLFTSVQAELRNDEANLLNDLHDVLNDIDNNRNIFSVKARLKSLSKLSYNLKNDYKGLDKRIMAKDILSCPTSQFRTLNTIAKNSREKEKELWNLYLEISDLEDRF